MATTIKVRDMTLNRLKDFKLFGRDTYDEVINRLMDESEAEVITEEEMKEIEEALADIRAGRVRSIEDVARDLGIKLK